ncbi:peptidase C14 caspase catalytic subunit p20 (plasmid) [Herpetosiphon aurantiacus DSM 785]|uniref:Peptidase C14 caspase catalytic subunit p20 n=1 Tax=Herpetosiphon aurantiacus (strain ATCC 23779 / DSM 785 / 114-95) TaxID=316274 RepID=A9B8T9_HERA2|nr:peptidase C14 caspase catalytic subunit p20 [Herpetosiphon aurantiacus DSM 785]
MATFDHGYALLIGVGTHHHPAYSLPVTANDAHAIQRILSDPRWCAYPTAHIRLLCNEAATTDAVLDGFAWLTACAQRDPQATIVVYYSGHGGRNEETDTYCLLPHDATTATSRLSTATLSAALDAIPAKRLLVLLDCCHAGGMTKDGPDQDSQWTTTAPSASMLAALQQGAGRVVLSSSTGKQRSYIQPDASLSLFTTHLLAAFQGAGNQPGSTEVRVTHLIQYVSRQVQHAAQALNARQTPFFQAASEDFVVSLIRGGAGLGKGGWEALQQDAHAAIAAASPPSPHPTITDSNVAIGNVVGGNLTQTKQSGGVHAEGATIGRIGTLTGGDSYGGDRIEGSKTVYDGRATVNDSTITGTVTGLSTGTIIHGGSDRAAPAHPSLTMECPEMMVCGHDHAVIIHVHGTNPTLRYQLDLRATGIHETTYFMGSEVTLYVTPSMPGELHLRAILKAQDGTQMTSQSQRIMVHR